MLDKSRIRLRGADVGPLGNGVLGALVGGGKGEPSVGQVQCHVAQAFVEQLRVACLQGIAADVGHGVVHGKEAGAFGLDAVRQGSLHFAQGYGIGSGGEPFIHRAMQEILILRIIVVIERMLIAQTDAGVAVFAEVATVLSKGGDIVLLNVSIGVGDGGLVNPIGVVALGEGHLRTRLNSAFPKRIGQYELGGVETAIGARLAVD